jgi:phage shock protein A
MQIFKSMGGFFRAKDRQAAEAIEKQNIVGFAQNDLDDIQKDLDKVTHNIGHIKGRIQSITDEITDLTTQISNSTSKVEKLLAKQSTDAEALAQQICAQIENLEQKKAVQEKALTDQKALLTQQQGVEQELRSAFDECKNEMELMKTEKEVTDANKSLEQVSIGSAQSAVSKFRDRRKILREQLYESKAMAEQSKESSKTLDQKADELLGKTKGSDLLEKMKAKRDNKI